MRFRFYILKKSRIGRSKENKFSSNIFGLPLVSNCCDELALAQHLNISKSNNWATDNIFGIKLHHKANNKK
jgi:hypothetical protein